MKIFAGILGILGGLLGMVAFSFTFLQGMAANASHLQRYVALGVMGEVASFTCIAMSIAIFAGAGRLAGAGLLAAALSALVLAWSLGGSCFVAFAAVGGALAIVPGRKRLPADELRERFEWETEQRVGSGH